MNNYFALTLSLALPIAVVVGGLYLLATSCGL